MVKRRAISREDRQLQPDKLPLLYKTLVPLAAERHGDYVLKDARRYDFAATANAIPLTADEFAAALRSYPIVLTGSGTPTPVALVGLTSGRNDHVDAEGNWTEGAYIPAYLRRYPFAFVKESETAERNILCADLSSTLFATTGAPDRALFADGKATPVLAAALDFCSRYEQASLRTRAAMEEAVKLDLVQPSSVTISRGGKSIKVEGFSIISEEKIRNLPDDVLASLARRGLLTIFAAHHLSLASFTSFGAAS